MPNGYDIRHLQAQFPLFSITHGLSIPGPILFVHGGVTLLGTTRKGEICLWGSADGERLQVMKQSCTFPVFITLSYTLIDEKHRTIGAISRLVHFKPSLRCNIQLAFIFRLTMRISVYLRLLREERLPYGRPLRKVSGTGMAS